MKDSFVPNPRTNALLVRRLVSIGEVSVIITTAVHVYQASLVLTFSREPQKETLQLTLDNLNPAISNQKRFPLDFLHTFTVILPLVT